MKHFKTLLAVLLCAAMLTCVAAADNTVTQTTDEDGHEITIVTDENGNQTIISEVEPGADDITFDEDELDLDAEEGDDGQLIAPAPSEAPETGTTGKTGTGAGPLVWMIPLFVAVCAAIVLLIYRARKQG